MSERKKVVLVTGSSRGIGYGILRKFGSHGYRVILNSKGTDIKEIENSLSLLKGEKVDVSPVMFDVRDRSEIESAFKKISGFCAGVDILVNNAGIVKDRTMVKMTGEDWDDVIGTNLTGVFNCCKAALPHMVETGWGRIINISSIIGQTGAFGQANYAASKAGIIGLTKSLAKEVAKNGVTVNAIAPGFIETSMTSTIPSVVKEKLVERIPARRFGATSHIAEAAYYLAADSSEYTTGMVLNVDGGY